MGVIDDAASRIEERGIVTPGTTLFGLGAKIPAGDGPFLSLIETPSVSPDFTHDRQGVAYQRPRFQVVARGRDSVAARALAQAVYDMFNGANGADGITNEFVNGVWYSRMRAIQEPFDLPVDEDDRARYAFTVEAHKRPN